jgi:hypothetical protein
MNTFSVLCGSLDRGSVHREASRCAVKQERVDIRGIRTNDANVVAVQDHAPYTSRFFNFFPPILVLPLDLSTTAISHKSFFTLITTPKTIFVWKEKNLRQCLNPISSKDSDISKNCLYSLEYYFSILFITSHPPCSACSSPVSPPTESPGIYKK